jgi:hypothetical protein
VDELIRIAEALEMSLRISAGWRGGDLERLLNARHSALHESVARSFLRLPDWVLAPEVSFAIRGERGWIDILAWHPRTRTLLIIELKTDIVDVNDLMGRVDQKRRLAAQIARDRGWYPLHVGVWVVIAEGTTNRRRVSLHETVLRNAFPVDGHAIGRWLADPAGAVAAMSFWSNASPASANGGLAAVRRVRRPKAKAA